LEIALFHAYYPQEKKKKEGVLKGHAALSVYLEYDTQKRSASDP
jgi:hypothetical protein